MSEWIWHFRWVGYIVVLAGLCAAWTLCMAWGFEYLRAMVREYRADRRRQIVIEELERQAAMEAARDARDRKVYRAIFGARQ